MDKLPVRHYYEAVQFNVIYNHVIDVANGKCNHQTLFISNDIVIIYII